MLILHAIKKLVHIAMQMFSGFKYSAIGIQNGRVDCLAYSIFYSPSRRCDSNWNTARSGSFHEASTIPSGTLKIRYILFVSVLIHRKHDIGVYLKQLIFSFLERGCGGVQD